MSASIACKQQAIARETFNGSLRWEQTRMIFNWTGILQFIAQLREIMHNTIQIHACILIAVRMQHPNAKTHTSIATWKSPGISTRSIGTPHNQEKLILRIVRRVEIVFGPIAITMEGFAHICTYTNMARDATGINGHGGAYVQALAHMIFNRHTPYLSIFHNDLLDGMTHAHLGTG